MTLKKEILAALKAKEAEVKLNNVSILHRWTESLDRDVDGLAIYFHFISGIKGGRRYDIQSRDYDGIMDEIQKYTEEYFAECAKKTVENIRNGYR